MNGRSDRFLGVSKIAAYAEDPNAFINAKGKAYNEKAARAGTAAHKSIGSRPSKISFTLIGIIVIGLICFLMGLV